SVNSLSAYTIDKMPGKAASFTASAELIDITDPFNMVTLGRDLCLTIGIYEESTDKQMNAISITLLGENSELLYSNNWDGSKTLPQRLNMNNGSGTIKVLGSAVLSSVEGEKVIPKEYALFQNYPNPFNPSTTIQYDLPEDSRVRIAVYDILGKEVSLIADGEIPAGRHQAVWNSQDHGSFASGIYILRISAESLNSSKNLISTKKMLLIK
ncbi:MAG: T9SS type A sorting domain-containing protein, partial [Ignavibacteria bacterium]|nr:T9SS type A sorting domain-containing protein [Ignavibacteria bacterium]